jgi:transposase
MQAQTQPKQTRRKFDKDFKTEALRMLTQGQSTASVARALNISEKLLYRWKHQSSSRMDSTKRVQPDEIAQLKAQLKRVEMERDILKKALIIFGQPT